MDDKKALWNSQQKLLKEMLLKHNKFDEAIELCLKQHSMIHSSEMSLINAVTFEDELWEGLSEEVFRIKPSLEDDTIAWNLWHSTRIEDITANILIAGGVQVISTDSWLEKMNVNVNDTGNSMSHDEIIAFSSNINMYELHRYRIAVGRRTQEIIRKLVPADIKRKMEPARLQRILDEGAVLNVEGANWLIDFWGGKNTAGILLMPVTRHQVVHINDSMRLKQKCERLLRKHS